MWEVEALVCGSPLHVAMMFTEESQDSTQVPFCFIMALPLSSKKKGYLTDNPNILTMDLANIQRSPPVSSFAHYTKTENKSFSPFQEKAPLQ